ncbi:hypothetical protein Goarm_021559, partial [Gossypium armourianum]|nr:hypothetical protein [Gossypium armourianum]
MADDGDDVPSNGDHNTKKVILKGMDMDLNRGKVVEMINVMAIDSSLALVVFWKDKLVGSGSLESGCEVDLEFLDRDIMKSIIKGIPAISFSKRIQKFLVKDMATMMKPSKPFHLMDVENKYFLVKSHGLEDYEKVFTQGSWIDLGQYLTVQPILEEIDGLIGKVAKFDFQTDSGSRGMFARMRVEFESLSIVCFACGRFGHLQNACPVIGYATVDGVDKSSTPVIILLGH